jgi:hypothetical protein
MVRLLFILGMLAFAGQGCARKPETIPLASFRVDYQTWSCGELRNEADLLSDALAVASEQRADDQVAHLRAATKALEQASASKKCRV